MLCQQRVCHLWPSISNFKSAPALNLPASPGLFCPRSPIKPVSLGSGGQPHLFHYLINHTRLALSSGGRSQMAPTLSSLLALLFLLGSPVVAHKHHSALNEAANAPVDSILWIHIVVQTIVWGFLFPIGMVLGLSRSRWHVPLQVCPFSLEWSWFTSDQTNARIVSRDTFDDRGIHVWTLPQG